MNTVRLQYIRDKVETMSMLPEASSIRTLADALVDLIDEVSRIDHVACQASDKATAAHELINKV